MRQRGLGRAWGVMALGWALGGCGGAEPATEVPAVDAGRDAGFALDRGGTAVDTGPAVTPLDAGAPMAQDAGQSPPVDTGNAWMVFEDAGAAPVDAGCTYEPVTADRNGEPRNAQGQIRWCWPGEARCFCDRDDDCYREAGYRPVCAPASGVAVDAGAPRDTGVVTPRDSGPAPADAGPATLCADPVPASTTGPQINLETINFNWSMQCYRPEDGSLFVFVEDTERQMVALRFYDYLNNGGPATGDTIDLANARVAARPFFLSGLSGIRLEPSWSADRSYLAYEGQVVFHQLQRNNPVGTMMRVEFRNVRLREVRTYTNGRCENVPNGARMFVRSLNLNLRVNNLHTDQDCIDWAGG